MSMVAGSRKNSWVLLGCAVLGLIVAALVHVPVARAATFDYELVISDDNFRDRDAITAAQIQAFLETQPGVLKSLVTSDYAGASRPASQIIYDACQAWTVSPKVMLTLLQKEQSLLTRTSLATNTLARAIGAGCPNASTNYYPGFGLQMFHGARLLDAYGEGKTQVVNGTTYRSYIPLYYAGIAKDIYDYKGSYETTITHIHPKNIATYKLYTYNPSIPGNTNFYNIYVRYFGDPFQQPRLRTVYRFKNLHNGNYFYTASIAERWKLAPSSTWYYEGAKFSWDASVTPTSTVPVWRFYNRDTHKYSFITSTSTYAYRRSVTGRRTWRYDGVAFRVATKKTTGALTLWRFRYRSTGGYLMTTAASTRHRYLTESSFRRKWEYLGAFYLPRSSVTTTATP